MGKRLLDLKEEMMKDEEFRREYEKLEEEFSIAKALIEARSRVGLTQKQVAERMGTTQSAVARMESGKPLPSLTTIKKYAKATNSKIDIRLSPVKTDQARS